MLHRKKLIFYNDSIRMNAHSGPKPIVKWAGGKRQLMNELLNCMPENFNTYFEPFAGGIALLTEIHKIGKLQHGVISDINPDIYNLYTIIQKNPGELIDSIGEIIYINDSVDYYDARSKFNAIKSEGIERATLFLYLNRHCYNGLYRVNAQGKFNVPFGKYSNPSIPSKEDILALSEVLQKCTILNLDFEIAVEGAREKDFVYFDPPYIPANKTSCFTDYNANGFSFEDQHRLSAVAKKLKDRNVYVMSSNSGFQKIKGLYPSFNINVTEGRRNINSKGEKRGKAEEIVITSYHHNVKYGNKL